MAKKGDKPSRVAEKQELDLIHLFRQEASTIIPDSTIYFVERLPADKLTLLIALALPRRACGATIAGE